MSEDIRLGNSKNDLPIITPARRLIPMQIGNATVYVEEVGAPLVIESDDIRPVAPPTPGEAFEKAGEILHECVRVLGERVEALAAKARPDVVTVEFSLSFEVKGKASLIPVFLTGETGLQTGLKVSAVWNKSESLPKI